MRSLLKEYRDGPGGKWKNRIRWYDGDTIRLQILTETGVANRVFSGDNKEAEAQQVWEEFKTKYPYQRIKGRQ